MLRSPVTGVVDFCVKRAWWVIIVALALVGGAGDYVVRHFAIHTDVNDLISPDLPWAQRALHYAREFPERDILVVVDAPTPENGEQATTKLAGDLRARPDLFRAVSQPGSGDFFEHNGLLFLPLDELKRVTERMRRADALIGTLASDPSLRGALDALSLAVNFANIIALPLLLGVGVAFKIYYIMAWRAGKTRLLQSSLTRAVVFSSMTTATAFGSLWLSSHPGTSSMGELMALACTMTAAVLFQPALMGPPRQKQ